MSHGLVGRFRDKSVSSTPAQARASGPGRVGPARSTRHSSLLPKFLEIFDKKWEPGVCVCVCVCVYVCVNTNSACVQMYKLCNKVMIESLKFSCWDPGSVGGAVFHVEGRPPNLALDPRVYVTRKRVMAPLLCQLSDLTQHY